VLVGVKVLHLFNPEARLPIRLAWYSREWLTAIGTGKPASGAAMYLATVNAACCIALSQDMAHELTVRGAAAIRQLAEVLRTSSRGAGTGKV
jgi:hypothetical protein